MSLGYQYADSTQLWFPLLTRCICLCLNQQLCDLVGENKLKLNTDKMELMLAGNVDIIEGVGLPFVHV